jgi:hypothetical protein
MDPSGDYTKALSELSLDSKPMESSSVPPMGGAGGGASIATETSAPETTEMKGSDYIINEYESFDDMEIREEIGRAHV